jgi:hypothetical protein
VATEVRLRVEEDGTVSGRVLNRRTGRSVRIEETPKGKGLKVYLGNRIAEVYTPKPAPQPS